MRSELIEEKFLKLGLIGVLYGASYLFTGNQLIACFAVTGYLILHVTDSVVKELRKILNELIEINKALFILRDRVASNRLPSNILTSFYTEMNAIKKVINPSWNPKDE